MLCFDLWVRGYRYRRYTGRKPVKNWSYDNFPWIVRGQEKIRKSKTEGRSAFFPVGHCCNGFGSHQESEFKRLFLDQFFTLRATVELVFSMVVHACDNACRRQISWVLSVELQKSWVYKIGWVNKNSWIILLKVEQYQKISWILIKLVESQQNLLSHCKIRWVTTKVVESQQN